MISDSELRGILAADIEKVIETYCGFFGLDAEKGKEVVGPATQSKEIAAELLQRREEARKTCKWRFEDGGFWKTDCKNAFYLEDGTLGENHMAFCPYCGHHIEETP